MTIMKMAAQEKLKLHDYFHLIIMLSRNEGLTLLKKYLRNENLRKHSFAVEAILREIACRLQKDEELWALTGLLHDLDYEYTKENPEKHATTTAEFLMICFQKKQPMQ